MPTSGLVGKPEKRHQASEETGFNIGDADALLTPHMAYECISIEQPIMMFPWRFYNASVCWMPMTRSMCTTTDDMELLL